eukprot:s100_g30.t3
MFPRSVLPPASVVLSWNDIEAALEYAAVEPDMWRAVARQLGDPDLSSLQIISILPSAVLRKAMEDAQVGARQRTAVEKGALSQKLKVKMSQVIDQRADQEVQVLSHDEIAKHRQQYMLAEGDAPREREEVTDAQLSCLKAKVSCEAAPFVDMGVWGPYGERIARQMKFTSQVLKDGQWKSVEIPGACNIEKWEESWRMFRTACIMLNIAAAAVLDRYASEFKQRVAEYPEAWHLAAQADMRCRTEFWPQERRRQESFFKTHPELSSFNPRQPWNSVIKASACNSEFWAREFEKPALRFQVMGPKDKQSKMPAVPHLTEVAEDWKPKFDPQRKDGRYLRSRSGINICYDWSRHEDGCNNDKCPQQFAHVCEWCRQPHRSINCPQRPGWTPPPPTTKGGGKGAKGTPKGGGKRRQS